MNCKKYRPLQEFYAPTSRVPGKFNLEKEFQSMLARALAEGTVEEQKQAVHLAFETPTTANMDVILSFLHTQPDSELRQMTKERFYKLLANNEELASRYTDEISSALHAGDIGALGDLVEDIDKLLDYQTQGIPTESLRQILSHPKAGLLARALALNGLDTRNQPISDDELKAFLGGLSKQMTVLPSGNHETNSVIGKVFTLFNTYCERHPSGTTAREMLLVKFHNDLLDWLSKRSKEQRLSAYRIITNNGLTRTRSNAMREIAKKWLYDLADNNPTPGLPDHYHLGHTESLRNLIVIQYSVSTARGRMGFSDQFYADMSQCLFQWTQRPPRVYRPNDNLPEGTDSLSASAQRTAVPALEVVNTFLDAPVLKQNMYLRKHYAALLKKRQIPAQARQEVLRNLGCLATQNGHVEDLVDALQEELSQADGVTDLSFAIAVAHRLPGLDCQMGYLQRERIEKLTKQVDGLCQKHPHNPFFRHLHKLLSDKCQRIQASRQLY